jgi:hypothetical protein
MLITASTKYLEIEARSLLCKLAAGMEFFLLVLLDSITSYLNVF